MHESDVNRLRKEIWRLALAALDMRLVANTAQELMDGHDPSSVVETGLVVTYCRSFSGPPKDDRKPEHVVDELAPVGDRLSLHTKLFEARNKLLAHTDEDYASRRRTVDVFGNHSYKAEYPPKLRPEQLFPIRALALALADRFSTAQKERERVLREAGVEPEEWLRDE
jgi:hypothetical protein